MSVQFQGIYVFKGAATKEARKYTKGLSLSGGGSIDVKGPGFSKSDSKEIVLTGFDVIKFILTKGLDNSLEKLEAYVAKAKPSRVQTFSAKKSAFTAS